MKRSDSSFKRRKQLNSNYVVLPDVLSVLKIEVYIKYAKNLFEEGHTSFNKKDIIGAYVQYKKFVEFVVNKLSHHKSYDAKPEEKRRLIASVKEAMVILEVICRKMDEIEDERIARRDAMLLIDAFDGEEEAESNSSVMEVITETSVEYTDDSPTSPPIDYYALSNTIAVRDDRKHEMKYDQNDHKYDQKSDVRSDVRNDGKDEQDLRSDRIEYKPSAPPSYHHTPTIAYQASPTVAYQAYPTIAAKKIETTDGTEQVPSNYPPLTTPDYYSTLCLPSFSKAISAPEYLPMQSPVHSPIHQDNIDDSETIGQLDNVKHSDSTRQLSQSKVDDPPPDYNTPYVNPNAITNTEMKNTEMKNTDLKNTETKNTEMMDDPFGIFTNGYTPSPPMNNTKINKVNGAQMIGGIGGKNETRKNSMDFKDCVRLLSVSEKEREEQTYIENSMRNMNSTNSTYGTGTDGTNKWYVPVPELVQLGQEDNGYKGDRGYKEEITPTYSKPIDRLAGVSVIDVQIITKISDFHRFFVPRPNTTQIDFKIGTKPLRFLRDDFQVLYSPFLRGLDSNLQMERIALETNRCFYLHLGIAMQIHPFCLQVAFRNMAALKMADTPTDDMSYDLLESVRLYAGFVDANCLLYLWPTEFDSCRICIISGSVNRPIFSCFFSQEGIRQFGSQDHLRDVIIYCNGSHFTLLRPINAQETSSFSVLNDLLSAARGAGLIVQENIVTEDKDSRGNRTSAVRTLQGLQEAARNFNY